MWPQAGRAKVGRWMSSLPGLTLHCTAPYLRKHYQDKVHDFYFESNYLTTLDGTARYAGLFLAPAEGFGLRPRLFLPFGQKKILLYCFG